MNLVEAAGEVGAQGCAVIASLEPVDEAVRESKVEKVSGAGIEPTRWEAEVARDSISSDLERFGQRSWIDKPILAEKGKNIDVSGRAANEPHGEEG
jgi:hypothetical protein